MHLPNFVATLFLLPKNVGEALLRATNTPCPVMVPSHPAPNLTRVLTL